MGTHATGNQVVWFDVPCVDLDRAISFYSALLDCEVSKMDEGGFQLGILPHTESSVGGCLAVIPGSQPSDQGVLVYLNCDGRLSDAVEAAESNGGTVLQPKHSIGPHGFRAIIKDSEGNRLALHSQNDD